MTTLINNLSTTIVNSLCNFTSIPTSSYIGSDVNYASTTQKIQTILPSTSIYLTSTGNQTFSVSQTATTITTPQIQSSNPTISLGSTATTLNMLNSGTLTMNNLLQYPLSSLYLNLITSNDSSCQKIQRATGIIVVQNVLTPISFPQPFTTIPTVLVQGLGNGARACVSAVGVSGFTILSTFSGFNYIAIGS
jgi:hypothetical protein